MMIPSFGETSERRGKGPIGKRGSGSGRRCRTWTFTTSRSAAQGSTQLE